MKQPVILMCPPDYYGIEYEINPWMNRGRGSTPDNAQKQWRELYTTLGDGTEAALPELPVQYADFSCWQRTIRPEGMCMICTAESVVLTDWPPGPDER